MTIEYESEWYSFATNTVYPLTGIEGVIDFDLITDITIISPGQVALDSIISYGSSVEFIFFSDGNQIGKATVTVFEEGDYPIYGEYTHPIGWLSIGPGIVKYNGEWIAHTFSNVYIIDSCVSFQTTHSTINTFTGDIVLEEGYNLSITNQTFDSDTVEATVIEFVPGLGSGYGIYCGEPIALDGVYTINSVEPEDDGNMIWSHQHFFLLLEDYDNNTIGFSLTIPEDRLNCTRTGYPGPKGWTGAQGPAGVNGPNAPEVEITYDYCDNPYRKDF